ncbi:MAG: oligosaccharide flippase family protein [Lunatimonas sp.]|uniref:oligosaccharide flippase family protein n=1 Tax=Lunatimonas sp. TaxID=2060141 RepID=UPI00263B81E0|nr:oligosaccharide flippase family protein [Lunatimonas sp.]MCC5938451.1 oligosaccharide flippase family protein [Lunatimonas sp.]
MIERIRSIHFLGLIRNRSLQNFIFLSLIQASNILITLVSMPLLITSIGVDQFGLVNLAFSVMVIANIFVSFGFNLSGPRAVALNQQNPKRLSFLISHILGGKVLMATIATGTILLLIFGFNLFRDYQTILALSVLLLFSEATLPLWFFQGLEKMKLISVANVISKLMYLAGIVLFIHTPAEARWVNLLLGGCGLSVNLLVLAYVRWRLGIVFVSPKIRRILRSLQSNLHYFLSNLTSYLTFNGGLVILSFFANSQTLGMYSLAEKIVMVIRLFPSILTQSVYPNAAKLFIGQPEKFIPFMRKVYLGGLALSLSFSAITFFAAPLIIQFLAKSRLEDAVFYLRLLSLIPFLACLNMVNVLFFLVTNQQQQLFRVSAWMCAFMVTTASILTYQFGVLGICIALLSTELLHFVSFSALVARKNPDLWRRFYLFA